MSSSFRPSVLFSYALFVKKMSIHGVPFLVSCVFFRYIKFDTFTPAAEKGLPVTRVISRMTLQQILAKAVGPEIIENSSNVVDFGDDGTTVCTKFDF